MTRSKAISTIDMLINEYEILHMESDKSSTPQARRYADILDALKMAKFALEHAKISVTLPPDVEAKIKSDEEVGKLMASGEFITTYIRQLLEEDENGDG